ncbi:hypothetical protein F901_03222 [Acinetobacter dispersus]|nr:hypothetical protein F901_03222 [Acinetobacter dispersus]
MKKYIKHLLGLVVLLGLSCSVYAEGGCPNGMTPVNNGQNWTCIPGGNDAAVQQSTVPQLPPQPTGYWLKTWGAVASDGDKGVLGVSTGNYSQNEAEVKALSECRIKGGKCQVFSYYNQCAALITGHSKYLVQGAATVDAASQLSMKKCLEKDKGCRVYYSACTAPEFIKY